MASRHTFLPRLQRLAAHFTPTGTTASSLSSNLPPAPAVPLRRAQYRAMAAAAEIPKTMKGVLIETTGGVEVLQYKTDLPVPVPKENEILVRNEVVGVNFIDTYFRSGLYPSTKPEILGRDGAGYAVTTSAANPHIKAGGRVIWTDTSGYAEYTAVPAKKASPVPDHISLSTACAALLQGLTALTLIEEAHHVNKGDWVLVPAAAGGTGGLLCQLLRTRGAHTIATASTEAKRQLALEYGADIAVPYDQTLDAVKQHTGGKGVVAVFDGVGQSTFDQSLSALALKGTMVSFGSASGAVEPFRIARLSEKNAKVCRPTVFNYLTTQEELEHYTNELWEVIGKEDGKGGPGRIRIEVHETYPLSEIKRAHQDLEGRKTTGKLLLDPTK